MQIQVNVNNLTLIQGDELNENEYNIHKIQFTFSEEYSDGLAKVALFTGNSGTYKVIITNNECNIPAEILANKDCFTLGVYAFDVEGDELIERFSPSPIKLYILDGSYIPDEDTENSETITPTDKEQILAELAKLEIDAEQIEINKQDIADIKQEQTEQNSAIQTNAENIEQVRNQIPTKTSQLTNDSNFVNQSQMTNAIDEETTARENADINLQEQIDAITLSSDVIDVLGTYQELQNYDTSHVKANDIIKILQDSTHNNAMSYYRWVITDHTGAWEYVGSEGPYYTKSEIDGKVQEINNDISNVEDNIAGLGNDIDTIEGTIEGIQEDIGNIETEQIDQNARITELEQEIEDLQNNQLTGTAEGTEIDITDSADSRVRSIELEGNSTQETTKGIQLFDKSTITSGYRLSTSDGMVADANYFTSDYIEVDASSDYIFNKERTQNYDRVIFYDNNKTMVSLNSSTSQVITTTGDTKYLRFSFELTELDTLMLQKGTTVADYEKYTGGIPSPNPEYEEPIYSAGDNVNEFDKDNANIINAYINNGAITEASNGKSLYITCKPNTTYTISRTAGTRFRAVTTTVIPAIGVSGNDYIGSDTSSSITITTSANAQYLCVNYYNRNTDGADEQKILNSIKIEEGSIATPYSPYNMGCISEKIVGQQLFQLEYIPVPNSPTNAFVKKGTYTIATCDGVAFNKNVYIKLFDKNKNVTTTGGHLTTQAGLSFSTSSYNYYGAAGLSSFVFTIDDDYYLSIGLLDSNNTRQIMLVQGSTIIREYQDYQEQTFTIPTQQPMRKIGDVRDFFFKNVQGSEYYDSTLTENAWYEKHPIEEIIIDGTETISIYNSVNRTVFKVITIASNFQTITQTKKTCKCNRFIPVWQGATWKYGDISTRNGETKNLYLTMQPNMTVVQFKTWLSNNNVIVDILLETPTNLQCTEAQTEALEEYIKARTYKPVTHMYSEDETSAYQDVVYVKDLETVINNLGGA